MDLYVAARAGDEQAVRELLAAGAATEAAAAGTGHVDVVRQLLQAAPATVSAVDMLGFTPLHTAAWDGHSAVVQLLLEAAPEAGWLVGRLGQEQRARLRTAALSLGRAAALLHGALALPAEVNHRILARALEQP
ncbi:expressed protein [Chlorella variabilis]|uniref:Expressed protein n=1 Tax=Chlorella variabilis TaxID=554065 RepID=E1ZG89_CHLVA|nr:expressed protein [Chlorella variabilis]EFN55251.1 expressed protein [Chlorella variabilis]|eukprot:XP_005847353.1 expressed protein [Chlorella variabilis]